MNTPTSDIVNIRKTRFGLLRWTFAALLATCASTLSIQQHAGASPQDGLRIKNVASANSPSGDTDTPRLQIRNARVPIFVDVDLAANGGAPAVTEDAINQVIAAIDANPKRLITLRFRGTALRFRDLHQKTRATLIEKRTDSVEQTFDSYMASLVGRLFDQVFQRRPGAPLTVHGLPFEGTSLSTVAANSAYRPVINRLIAIAADGSLVVSNTVDEESVIFRRVFPNALDVAGDRPILFAANGVWRIATAVEAPLGEALFPKPGLMPSLSHPEVLTTDLVDDLAASVPDSNQSALPASPDAGLDSDQQSGFPAEPPVGSALNGSRSQSRGSTEMRPRGGHRGGRNGSAVTRGLGGGGLAHGEWSPASEIIETPMGELPLSAPNESDEDFGQSSQDETADDDLDPSSEGGSSGDLPIGENHGGGYYDNAGAGEPVGDNSQDVQWATFDELRSLIGSVEDGGTLDLSGRGFFPASFDDYVAISDRDIKIKGGHFSAARPAVWTQEPDGCYSAPLDTSLYPDLRLFLVDTAQDRRPLVGVFPAPAEELDELRYTHQRTWLTLRNADVNNGDVITEAGMNVFNSRILGMVISDPEVRYQVASQFALDSPESFTVLIHAGPNVVSGVKVRSWNSQTGRLEFDDENSLLYRNYLNFALTGSRSLVKHAGEYAIDAFHEKIYYQPAAGSPQGAMVPCSKWIFRLSGGNIEFENSTFFGNRPGGNATLISCTGDPNLSLRRCYLHSADAATGGAILRARNCVFEYFLDRGLAATHGSEIVGNVIKYTQNQSAVLIGGGTNEDPDPMRHTLVEGNYISIPGSTHGQGISLYWDSWQRATVRHNIFHNCDRAIAFQPNTNSGLRRPDSGVFLLENNLILNDRYLGYLPGGQQTVAFNRDDDTHLSSDQQVVIRNNSAIVVQEAFPQDVGLVRFAAFDVRYLVSSTVRVEGNLLASIDAPDQSEGVLGHLHSCNLLYSPVGSAAHGEFDLGTPSSLSSVLDATAPMATGWAGVSASDGGRVGIRWSQYPEWGSFDSLGVDWALDYSRQEISESPLSLSGRVFRGQDLR